MALVKCPECGKENISDSAASCPVCGFGIAEYFEMEYEKADLVVRKRNALEEAQEKYEKELHKIEDMKRPSSKPSLVGMILEGRGGLVAICCGIFSAIFAICVVAMLVIDIDSFAAAIVLCIPTFIFGGVCYVHIKDVKSQYDREISRLDNWEAYKDELRRNAKMNYDNVIANIEKNYVYKGKKPAESAPVAVQPKPTGLVCPICGSRNIKRIGTVSRAVSVELVGLASSKIGKQYECQKCKHLW